MKTKVEEFFENTKDLFVDEPTIELFRHYLREVSKRSIQRQVIHVPTWGDA